MSKPKKKKNPFNVLIPYAHDLRERHVSSFVKEREKYRRYVQGFGMTSANDRALDRIKRALLENALLAAPPIVHKLIEKQRVFSLLDPDDCCTTWVFPPFLRREPVLVHLNMSDRWLRAKISELEKHCPLEGLQDCVEFVKAQLFSYLKDPVSLSRNESHLIASSLRVFNRDRSDPFQDSKLIHYIALQAIIQLMKKEEKRHATLGKSIPKTKPRSALEITREKLMEEGKRPFVDRFDWKKQAFQENKLRLQKFWPLPLKRNPLNLKINTHLEALERITLDYLEVFIWIFLTRKKSLLDNGQYFLITPMPFWNVSSFDSPSSIHRSLKEWIDELLPLPENMKWCARFLQLLVYSKLNKQEIKEDPSYLLVISALIGLEGVWKSGFFHSSPNDSLFLTLASMLATRNLFKTCEKTRKTCWKDEVNKKFVNPD